MKHRLIWLRGGSVSHLWTIPLIGQSSEHNFRRVERDISCLRKLFRGILVLYINSKRLGSQVILSQSVQWQWAVLEQLNVWRLHIYTCHFKVWLRWKLNNWHQMTLPYMKCFLQHYSYLSWCMGFFLWLFCFFTKELRGFSAVMSKIHF